MKSARQTLPWLIIFVLMLLLIRTWTHPDSHCPARPVWKSATWFDTTTARR